MTALLDPINLSADACFLPLEQAVDGMDQD